MPTKADGFRDFVLDQLANLSEVTCRAMFGGYGLYRQGKFFGIIHKGRLYFKVSQASIADYKQQGMKPFRPNAKQTLKSFYEVPADILEDSERMTTWAAQASATHD